MHGLDTADRPAPTCCHLTRTVWIPESHNAIAYEQLLDYMWPTTQSICTSLNRSRVLFQSQHSLIVHDRTIAPDRTTGTLNTRNLVAYRISAGSTHSLAATVQLQATGFLIQFINNPQGLGPHLCLAAAPHGLLKLFKLQKSR